MRFQKLVAAAKSIPRVPARIARSEIRHQEPTPMRTESAGEDGSPTEPVAQMSHWLRSIWNCRTPARNGRLCYRTAKPLTAGGEVMYVRWTDPANREGK